MQQKAPPPTPLPLLRTPPTVLSSSDSGAAQLQLMLEWFLCKAVCKCVMPACTGTSSRAHMFRRYCAVCWLEMYVAMWVDTGVGGLACVSVYVSAAVAVVHCARGGYGILFLFLTASPFGAQPASVNCGLQCYTAPLLVWRMLASGPTPAVQGVCLCCNLFSTELQIFMFTEIKLC